MAAVKTEIEINENADDDHDSAIEPEDIEENNVGITKKKKKKKKKKVAGKVCNVYTFIVCGKVLFFR